MATAEPGADEEADGPRATVVVDDLHVTYRVVGAGSGLRPSRLVHALKGVSFVAREGDAIGLIGRNGSGKSTLLRAIAGLQPATSGRVYASAHPQLLGVNAALIKDLSGERNVVLGGLAMGLSPRDVRARYADIVDFAGLEGFMDLPMRTYSSGMAARLRFAISTATTPEILLVDEALATGDADFRKRSEERIRDLRSAAGTVFLVSHSLSAIEHTCNRALWIDRGTLRQDGAVTDVLAAYRAALPKPKPKPKPKTSPATPAEEVPPPEPAPEHGPGPAESPPAA